MTCKKCGSQMGAPRYYVNRFADTEYCGGEWAEHLHYYCRCGYSETTPTRDAKHAATLGALRGETP